VSVSSADAVRRSVAGAAIGGTETQKLRSSCAEDADSFASERHIIAMTRERQTDVGS